MPVYLPYTHTHTPVYGIPNIFLWRWICAGGYHKIQNYRIVTLREWKCDRKRTESERERGMEREARNLCKLCNEQRFSTWRSMPFMGCLSIRGCYCYLIKNPLHYYFNNFAQHRRWSSLPFVTFCPYNDDDTKLHNDDGTTKSYPQQEAIMAQWMRMGTSVGWYVTCVCVGLGNCR